VPGRELNPQPLDCKSDALPTAPRRHRTFNGSDKTVAAAADSDDDDDDDNDDDHSWSDN